MGKHLGGTSFLGHVLLNRLKTAGLLDLAFLIAFATHLRIFSVTQVIIVLSVRALGSS